MRYKMLLVSDGTEEQNNACCFLGTQLADVIPHWDIISLSDFEEAKTVPADLMITFGAKVYRRMMDSPPKHKEARRELQESDSGVPMGVTFDSSSIYYNATMLQTVVDDILWAVNRVENPPKEPRLKTSQRQLEGFFSLDIETEGFEYWNRTAKILTSVAGDTEGNVSKDWGTDLTKTAAMVDNPFNLIAGHNIKYDMNWLESRGILWRANIFDTEVAAGLLNDNIKDNALGFLISRETDMPYHKDMVDRANLVNEDQDVVMHYNALDAVGGAKVAQVLHKRIKEEGFEPLFDFLMEMVPVFSRMERRGVMIDLPLAKQLGNEVRDRMEKGMAAFPDVNTNSPKQLAAYLFDELGLTPVSYSDEGQPSTKASDIETILRDIESGLLVPPDGAEETLNALLDLRAYGKLWGTYFKKIPEYTRHDGRIHSSWQLVSGEFGGTVTGRTSSRSPNLQQIPMTQPGKPNVRAIFRATPGFHWWDADYSALEMRVVADLAKEQVLIDAFERGWDIHTAAMAEMYDEDYEKIADTLENKGDDYELWKFRRVATKTTNFLMLYGGGPGLLAANMTRAGNPMGYSEAMDIISEWFSKFSSIAAFMDRVGEEVKEKGQIRTVTGHRRILPGAGFDGPSGWRKVRQATNLMVQEVASRITMLAMYLMDKHIREHGGPGCWGYLLLNVHDQMAGEAPKDWANEGLIKEIVHDIMVKQVPREFEERFGYRLTVPLGIDINVSDRWS